MCLKKVFDKVFTKNADFFYFIFRLLAGLLFMQHGAQKLLGAFGGSVAARFSLFWFAGVIELIGGFLITLGLFSRLVAFVAAIEMLVAFFKAHFPSGWIPIVNKGELALLFFVIFLVILVYGSGRYSLDRVLFKKEIF